MNECSSFKGEAKSWQQLQAERDAIVEAEVVKTKHEAEEMAARAKNEDLKRQNAIQMERQRVESAEQARENLMKAENEERERRNLERKETIRRQTDLLAGSRRGSRPQALPPAHNAQNQGIQVLHYKDPGNIITSSDLHHQSFYKSYCSCCCHSHKTKNYIT